MTDNGFQAALQGVVVDKQQSIEQQKEVIEEMKAQYDRNDDKISEMMDVFFELKDARDNIVEDEGQDLFDKSVNVCNDIIEKIEELDFVKDLAKSEKVIKKQLEIINILKEEIKEMGELADVEVIFDDKNKESDKEGATNVDNASRELLWHEVKTEAEKHAEDNLMIRDVLEDIKKEFSDKSSVIDKSKKGEERNKLIEELKEFKIKETQRLHKIIQERNAVLQQQESHKKEVFKELGSPGTVYAEKGGSYRRIQITEYSEGFGEITYNEDEKKETVTLDEFREVIGSFESSKFYVPIKIEQEFHIGKALEPGADNKKEFPTIRVERYVTNDKQLVVKKFVGQKGEFVKMTEDELRTLIKDGEYAIQARKQKKDNKLDADEDELMNGSGGLFSDDEFADLLGDDKGSEGDEKSLVGDESVDFDIAQSSDEMNDKMKIEIEGIEQLDEWEQEIIKHIFLVVKDEFAKVDQKDENAIQHFWEIDVSKFIREENGESLKESIETINNITRILKENLKQIDDTVPAEEMENKNVDGIYVLEQEFGKGIVKGIIEQSKLFYENLKAEDDLWEGLNAQEIEEELDDYTRKVIRRIIMNVDAEYAEQKLTDQDVLNIYKKVVF